MARVFQIGDLLVHAVDDFEVCLLLALVQTLQVGWLACSLFRTEQAFRGTSSSACR